MSLTVAIGLLFALATALASIVGFLYKQRGAVGAPPVRWRHPVRSTLALFAHPAWTAGLIVATASWGLHATALALAPITLVQTVIAGGLVFLTVIAERLFGLPVSRREWIGVGLTAVGLAFLAATLGDVGAGAYSRYDGTTLTLYVGVVTLGSLVLCVAVAARRLGPALALATAAGLQWGASDVTIKALSGHLHADGALVLLTPAAAAIAILSLVGMVVSARSLQLGQAVAVIATTSSAANLVTIASGLVVFAEPLPSGAGATAVRLLAFALVIGAAAMTPSPATAATTAPHAARG